MGMKGRFYAGCLAIALLAWGGQGTYTAVTNREPARYGVRDYLSDQPDTKWLTLEDAQLDLSQASYSQTRVVGTINELYVPVFSQDVIDGEPIQIILATDDKDMIQTVKDIEALPHDQTAVLDYVTANRDNIWINREVSGLVKYGFSVDDDTRRDLENIYGFELVDEFAFLQLDAKPNSLLSILSLIGGFTVGGLLLKPLFSGRSPEPTSPQTPPEAAPET
ncbi:MAG: hypothetical protein AAGA75_23680 [Cyanobacteria bacterium P01_E01_bin.6]